MIKLTYNEWQKLGYVVKKGEKSKERNEENIPIFSEEQVIVDFDVMSEILGSAEYAENELYPVDLDDIY